LARRNLGDVLHYFIPEDEQNAARERRAEAAVPHAPREPHHGPAPRICMPVAPERLLWCALALELAGALASEYGEARVIAQFPISPLLPEVPGVRLERAAAGSLGAALDEVPTAVPALALERRDLLAAFLASPERARFDALLLPVDGGPSGVARALSWLREFAPGLSGLRVLAWIVGAESAQSAAELGTRLAGAARRQHSLDVELAGVLPRDAALYRALLRGESVHELEADGPGAQGLRALSRRLGVRRAA
jgi:hypothetical protein